MEKLIGKRVLVVEDDPMTLVVSTNFFQLAGAEVITATNLEDAINALEKNPIDFIYTDTQYPASNDQETISSTAGVDLSNYVHNNHPNIIVIATSGSEEVSTRQLYDNQGHIAAYHQKPVNRENLINTCDRLLKEHDINHTFPFTEEQLDEFRSAGQMGTVCELYRVGKDYFSAHSDDKGKYTGDLDFAIGLNHLHRYILENRPKD
jgi:DNA-binding NtrC family response regulator